MPQIDLIFSEVSAHARTPTPILRIFYVSANAVLCEVKLPMKISQMISNSSCVPLKISY